MSKIWNNKRLLTKAAVTSSSFSTGFGLSQEESNKFIDYLIDESRLKDKVRVERFNSRTKKINKLFLTDEEVLVPATVATDPGETVGIRTEQITLTGKELIAVARISDDSLEDNIEGDQFADHVMRMVAKAAANQIVKALLLGKLDASPTKATQVWDGWYPRALAGGHIVDALGYDDRFISTPKLSALMKAIPNKYLEDGAMMAYILARHIKQDYRDLLANRGTSLGDAAVQGAIPLKYGDVDLDAFNTVPTTKPVLVTGGVSTTVSGNEAAGQTVITLASAAGLEIGDVVVFDHEGSREEYRTITNIAGADITVAATTFAHDDGTTVKEATADGSFAMLTDYKNLIWGIQREITIETDRLPRLRSTDWVLHLRMDAQIENPDMVGVLKNLKVRP